MSNGNTVRPVQPAPAVDPATTVSLTQPIAAAGVPAAVPPVVPGVAPDPSPTVSLPSPAVVEPNPTVTVSLPQSTAVEPNPTVALPQPGAIADPSTTVTLPQPVTSDPVTSAPPAIVPPAAVPSAVVPPAAPQPSAAVPPAAGPIAGPTTGPTAAPNTGPTTAPTTGPTAAPAAPSAPDATPSGTTTSGTTAPAAAPEGDFASTAQADLQKATTALDAVDERQVKLAMDRQSVDDLVKLIAQARDLVNSVHAKAVNELDVELKFGDNWVGRSISRRLREVAVGDEQSAVAVIGDFLHVLFDVEETIRKAARNLEEADEEAVHAVTNAGRGQG